MFQFSRGPHAFWQSILGLSNDVKVGARFVCQIKDKTPFGDSVFKLHRDDDAIFVVMTSSLAKELAVSESSSLCELEQALNRNKMKWYDEDALFYFSCEHQMALLKSTAPDDIRELMADKDAELFSDFEKRNSLQDLDDVGLELTNDALFGFIHDGSLECVADYYLWPNTKLADIGVLSVPAWRGKGIASRVVEALSRHALIHGLIPQYRCQLDNLASLGLTKRLGLQRYGLWTTGVPIEAKDD